MQAKISNIDIVWFLELSGLQTSLANFDYSLKIQNEFAQLGSRNVNTITGRTEISNTSPAEVLSKNSIGMIQDIQELPGWLKIAFYI